MEDINMTDAERATAAAIIKADREANPELYREQDDQKLNWDDMAAGGYSALNSALFGIPDVVMKAISSDAYKALKDLRDRNRTASTVGDIAGMFAPTGGMLAHGAGAGLKLAGRGAEAVAEGSRLAKVLGKGGQALDTAGDIIKGSKAIGGIKGGLAQGALAAGEQVIPRVLTGQEDLKTGLTNVALGAGIGGVAKAVPSVLRSAGIINKGEAFTKPLSEAATDAELAARGISGRDIKRAITTSAKNLGVDATGSAVNRAEEIKKAALDVLKKNDILNPDEAQAFIQGTGKKFEELSKAFDASGFKISDIKDQILADPSVVQFIEDHGDEGKKIVDDLITKLDRKSGLNGIKSALTDEIKFANKATDRLQSDTGDVASAIKDKLDEAVLALDPNYDSYKADWKALQPLRYMVARDKMSITPVAKAGSDTAAKAMMLGLGGSAGVTSALKDFDPQDPSTWTPAALKAVGGLVAGGVVNKLAPGVANKLIGSISSAINNPKFIAALEKAGVSTKGLAEKLAKLPIEKPLVAIEKLAGTRGAEAPMPEPTEQELQAALTRTEAGAPDAVKAEAKAEVNQKYLDRITTALQNDYIQYFAPQGMSYEDFIKQAAEVTNNFDPMKSAKVLFKDKTERKKYLEDYRLAMSVKSADLGTMGQTSFIDNILEPQTAASMKSNLDNFVDTIASRFVSGEGLAPKTLTTSLKKDILGILQLKATPDEKKQLLIDKLGTTYNVDFTTLKDLGLV